MGFGRVLRMGMRALLCVLAATCGLGLWARTIGPDEAGRVARNWVRHVLATDGAWGAHRDASVLGVRPVYEEGTLVAFAADVLPGGFVLVPAEDALPAVKGYSTTNDFDQEDPAFGAWVGRELLEVTRALRGERGAGVVFASRNAALWRWLGSRREDFQPLPEAGALPAPLLVTSAWDQGDPYNMLCPSVGGTVCPVGCVATATAQVMRYWDYPPQGQSSTSYGWRGQTLSADFAHPYDWSDMPDALSFRSSSAEKTAVATLCSDVGVAFHMDYDPAGSGAYTTDAVRILPAYFLYSSDVRAISYTGNDDTWFAVFQEQVDEGRPCLFSIRGSAGGHAVVVDGYRTDGGNLVHINMGWGGPYSAYYATNNIVAGGYDFQEIQSQTVVADIHPQEARAPEAVAAISAASSTAPVAVNLAGQGRYGTPPFVYAWDFGDGSAPVAARYATHLYTVPGVYTVTLTVTDGAGQSASDPHLSVTVQPPSGLTAAAVASVAGGRAPLAVDFSGAAAGGVAPYAFAWDFGDGTAGSGPGPAHTYASPGTYTVTLTATDASSAAAQDKHLNIAVASSSPPPVITGVAKVGSPFRLKVFGSGFLDGCTVRVDGTAVPQTVFKSAGSLVAKGGSTLKAMVPKGQTVYVTAANPDGGVSDTYAYSY